MLTNTDITMMGEGIQAQRTKRGVKISGPNHERRGRVTFGTVKGSRYEKEGGIFWKYNSICLKPGEYKAATEVGATVITAIEKDRKGRKKATRSIGADDFYKYKRVINDGPYGEQWAVDLSHFGYSPLVVPRNPILDNPPVPVERDIIAEKRQLQMSLFGMGERGGNVY